MNYNWNYDLDYVESNQVSLVFNFPKILDVNIDYYSLNNFVQFQKTNLSTEIDEEVYVIRPIQYDEKIDFFRVNFNKKITFGKFTFDSRIMYQKSSDENKVSFPEIVTRNTFFYSTEMFKKALFLQSSTNILQPGYRQKDGLIKYKGLNTTRKTKKSKRKLSPA